MGPGEASRAENPGKVTMHPVENAQRFDFYTATHKGQRRRLFGFTQRVGTADFTDPDAVDAVGDELQRISRMLKVHAQHETEFIHPFLSSKYPQRAEFLDGEHGDLSVNLVELEAFFEDIQSNPCIELQCRTFGREFYRALQRFISRYLDHMDEEERTMIQLWQNCTLDELRKVIAELRASMTPDQEREELWDMLPALNNFELVKLFSTLRMGVDEERYQNAWAVAEQVLDPRDYQSLRTEMEREKAAPAD